MSDMEPSDGEGSDVMQELPHSDDGEDDSETEGRPGRPIAPSDDEDAADDDDDDDDDEVPEAEDDEDDDDDDEKAVPQKKQQHISQFYGAVPISSGGGSKSGASGAPKKGKASAPPAAACRANGKQKAKSKSKLLELKASDDEDSDAEQPTRDLVRKPLKLSAAAADPFEEHDQLRRQYANGSTPKGTDAGKEEVLPKVNLFQIADNTFLLKNDKGPQAKRFWRVNAEKACVHAPNYKGLAECAHTMTVDTLMQSRKDREAMLATMASDADKLEVMAQEAMVFQVTVDPSGSGGGPGINNVVGFLPYRIEDTEESMEGFFDQYLDTLDLVGAAEFPNDARCTFLMPIDEKLMKKILKAGKFPRMYDSNRLSSTKYRVISKMEEQAKIDTNFTLLPPPVKVGKGKRKRSGGGAANGASKKAKPTAAGGAPANGHAGDTADDEEEEGVHVQAEPCFTRIKWTAIPAMGVSMAGIKVAPGTEVRLMPAGEGSYILVKTPAGP